MSPDCIALMLSSLQLHLPPVLAALTLSDCAAACSTLRHVVSMSWNTCLQVLLLSGFEQGLVYQTATAVQLITTTPASKGYMMSRGMVSPHHTTTGAFIQNHTMCPFGGCAQALPAD